MIKRSERFWVGSGSLLNGGPYTWDITDFDQRRYFAVTYAPPTPLTNQKDIEDTENICMQQLKRNVDNLGDDVVGIRFTDPHGPITTTSDAADDVTTHVNNYPLSTLDLPFAVKTIFLPNLTELERLGPQVDKVSYASTPCRTGARGTVAAFKYWFMHNGMFRKWYELNNWSRLPRDHPHIVPFDAVVLDPIQGGVVGFTTLFIPGGTLKDNDATSRPFRLQWFHQLLSAIDDLNYTYGIMHQDIAPRNLVIDETDNLRIFDFNYAIMIDKHYTPARDDYKGVIFTLYEIVTLDEQYRSVPHEEQDAEALLQKEWTAHPDVELDSPLQSFRDVLHDWTTNRKQKEFTPKDTWVKWPFMPKAPLRPIPIRTADGDTIIKQMSTPAVYRKALVELKEPFWNWERPANPVQASGS